MARIDHLDVPNTNLIGCLINWDGGWNKDPIEFFHFNLNYILWGSYSVLFFFLFIFHFWAVIVVVLKGEKCAAYVTKGTYKNPNKRNSNSQTRWLFNKNPMAQWTVLTIATLRLWVQVMLRINICHTLGYFTSILECIVRLPKRRKKRESFSLNKETCSELEFCLRCYQQQRSITSFQTIMLLQKNCLCGIVTW